MTAVEAAKMVGVDTTTIQAWLKQGELVAVSGPEIDGGSIYRFERARLTETKRQRR